MKALWINCLHMVFGAVVGVFSMLYVMNYKLALSYQGKPQFFEIELETFEQIDRTNDQSGVIKL